MAFVMLFFFLLYLPMFGRVFSMQLGSDLVDKVLFTENDRSCCVDITSTKDDNFITINSNSRTSSEEGHLSMCLCY